MMGYRTRKKKKIFFLKQKTAYEIYQCDWSSDVCSSDLKEKNPDCLIMLGGAPLTRDVANLFGADGYAESAGNAVSEGIKMIGNLRKFEKGEIE